MVSDIQRRNAEILGEIRIRRDELYVAILGLENAVSAPSKGRIVDWAHGVADHVERVRAAFKKHVAITENPGGLFDDVMDQAPRLAHAIAELRRNHKSLQSLLDDAERSIPNVHNVNRVERTRARLLDLIRDFLEHRHRGSELVYDAYNVDLGAGD